MKSKDQGAGKTVRGREINNMVVGDCSEENLCVNIILEVEGHRSVLCRGVWTWEFV